jgi:hypothetical protein
VWRLEVPPGFGRRYHLAQLDDYGGLGRRAFPWQPPLELRLRARSSVNDWPGTWGFGLWNDPFSLALAHGTQAFRLPTLPQAAWFFFAAAPNYLSLRDDLPAQGGMAAVFEAAPLTLRVATRLALSAPGLLLRPLARRVRRSWRRWVTEAGAALEVDATVWQDYCLRWQATGVQMWVGETCVLATPRSPRPPLALVFWIDNQWAAFRPDGRWGWGLLAHPGGWLEMADVTLTQDGRVHEIRLSGA